MGTQKWSEIKKLSKATEAGPGGGASRTGSRTQQVPLLRRSEPLVGARSR